MVLFPDLMVVMTVPLWLVMLKEDALTAGSQAPEEVPTLHAAAGVPVLPPRVELGKGEGVMDTCSVSLYLGVPVVEVTVVWLCFCNVEVWV